MLRIFMDYLELSRSEHLRIDFGLPILVGIAYIVLLLISNVPLNYLVSGVSSSVGIIITAFSILAGFNATSLTIFATSNSQVAKMLKEELIEGTNKVKMEQILACFSWSVVAQLTLLFLSVIISFLFSYGSPLCSTLLQHKTGVFLLWLLIFGGIVGVLYSIVLTIRNVIILYLFLVADSRK